jgi:hypothetical protein
MQKPIQPPLDKPMRAASERRLRCGAPDGAAGAPPNGCEGCVGSGS